MKVLTSLKEQNQSHFPFVADRICDNGQQKKKREPSIQQFHFSPSFNPHPHISHPLPLPSSSQLTHTPTATCPPPRTYSVLVLVCIGQRTTLSQSDPLSGSPIMASNHFLSSLSSLSSALALVNSARTLFFTTSPGRRTWLL